MVVCPLEGILQDEAVFVTYSFRKHYAYPEHLACCPSAQCIPADRGRQQPATLSLVVDKIVAQEQAEMQFLRQYSPLVETYIQTLRPDDHRGAVPDSDKYFSAAPT